MNERTITYIEALREALREEMERDVRVFLLGEDIQKGYGDGLFGVTRNLVDVFGEERVRNTPISEIAIVGTAVGAALTGMRPVAEIMYSDWMTLAMEPIVNIAAKLRFLHGGETKVPLVVRTTTGGRIRSGPCHSQSLEAWFLHVPGIKVVEPSTPYDAKGLLKTAIRDDNPVVFFEHKLLYKTKGVVPTGEYTIPFGEADFKRRGNDVSIIATSIMVNESLEAAKELESEGIESEVVDPRTLIPFDKQTVLDSVKKTGKVVIVEEGCRTGGIGAEIAAMIYEEAFDCLDAPIKRVASPDVPIAFSPPLEDRIIPNKDSIVSAVKSICKSARA
jgi:pyruvate dehydrogenase E1 component beta subunit